jgi:hypothetical protein
MTIPSALEVSGDLLAAATTLAGLILVFLGTTYASYQSITGILRDGTVRKKFRCRAWFMFIGFSLSLASALLGLIGKWFHHERYALAAVVLFVIALFWVLLAAIFLIRDIE